MTEDRASQGTLVRLGPLLAAMFLGFLTVSVPLPVLPLHVHGTLGFGTATAGLAVGISVSGVVGLAAPGAQVRVVPRRAPGNIGAG